MRRRAFASRATRAASAALASPSSPSTDQASWSRWSTPRANGAEPGSYAVSVISARRSPIRRPAVGCQWRGWARALRSKAPRRWCGSQLSDGPDGGRERAEDLLARPVVEPGAGRPDLRHDREARQIGQAEDVVEVEVRQRDVDAGHAVEIGRRVLEAGPGIEDERVLAVADEHARGRTGGGRDPAAAAEQPGVHRPQLRTACDGAMPGVSLGSGAGGPAVRASGITPAQTSRS